MQYKAIVLDLDGTLTNDKKEITPRTKNALMKAQELGVRIILASGRPTFGIEELAEELEIGSYGGFVLAFNGGKVLDWGTKQVVFEKTLDENLVPILYDAAMEHGFQILTYQGKGIAASDIKNKYVLHEAFINQMPVFLYENFLQQIQYPINKCLIVGDPNPLHELELKLAKQLENKMNVYRSAAFFLECVPLGIDKAASLARLLDSLQIRREELIACGDGYNDLSMIEFAGLGVAMANAAREVLDAADYVTYSNNEDGIAHIVDKFILRG